MKKHIRTLLLTVFSLFCVSAVQAQFGSPYIYLVPDKPTSADNLKLSMTDRTCGGGASYVAQPYFVSMTQNNITVRLGEQKLALRPLCPYAPQEEIDLGRLPAGSYTITVIGSPSNNPPNEVVLDITAFTVTNARFLKTAPYVRLDYSGHWWDSDDSGWGLFIWHDARDNVLAAWFTYTPDGKPVWYVFQPKWRFSASPTFIDIGIMVGTTTFPADLMQTSRMPGPTSPPPNPTSMIVVGTASLDFSNFGTADGGKLTYTFNGGPTLVRNIKRFKP